MATGKSGVKIEIVFLVFQKDIAKMCIAMADNGRCLSHWIKYYSCALNQLAQCRPLPFPCNNRSMLGTDRPTVVKEFFERYHMCTAIPVLIRKRNNFPMIEVLKTFACQAMPEELVNRSTSVFFTRASRERLLVDSQ